MKRVRKQKNIIIGIVMLALFVMTAGYAAYQKRLNISGVANIDYKDWNIRILSIENVEASSGVDVIEPSHTNTTAKFNSKITKVGGYIKYKIVVKNSGTIDGVLGAINIEESSNSVITYTVSVVDVDDELKVGEEATIYVTATYDESKVDTATTNTSNVSVNLTYVQLEGYEQTNFHAIKYRNIVGSESLVSSIHHEDTLIVDLSSYNVHYLKIYINNLETTEYSYVNNILTIENVTGDVIVMNDDFTACNASTTDGLVICANNSVISGSKYGDFELVNGSLSETDDNGILFNGSTSFKYDFDASVDINDEYSVSLVINTDTTSYDTTLYGKTAFAISDTQHYYLAFVDFLNDSLFAGSYKTGAFADNGSNSTSFDYTSYNNKKTHITMTGKRNGKSYVYVNGNLVSEFTSNSNVIEYSYITIGDLRPKRIMYWQGTMYDIKFYNRQLSSDEVVANYNKDNVTYGIE